jgi:hypothetical protein
MYLLVLVHLSLCREQLKNHGMDFHEVCKVPKYADKF